MNAIHDAEAEARAQFNANNQADKAGQVVAFRQPATEVIEEEDLAPDDDDITDQFIAYLLTLTQEDRTQEVLRVIRAAGVEISREN